MGLQIDLSNYQASTEAVYTFNLQVVTPLEQSSFMKIWFDPALAIVIPETLHEC
jgi:hypothetical protein